MITSKGSLTCLLIFLGIQLVSAQKIGEITLGEKFRIYSEVLNEEREFWISLPESYNRETLDYKRYPLLILLDGHVHFKSVSGMVHSMSAGYNNNRRIPEMIVVAIQNVNRERDFTPDKVITKRKNDTGGGDQFLDFLEKELIPSLDKKYRTIQYRLLVGHSLGGLITAHAYLKETTAFNAFIAIDPSFGTWDAATMDGKIEKVSDNSFNRCLYIATANWGKRNFRNRDRHVRFYETLHRRCNKAFNSKLVYYEQENHGSVPLIATYDGLSYIFSGYGISYRNVGSKEELTKQFQSLSQRLNFDFHPPEAVVNRIAYRFLRSKNPQQQLKALDFFLLNTTNYPNSFNVFDSLGEAYAILGEKEKAIQNFKKSLALNPKNENAKTALKDLGK